MTSKAKYYELKAAGKCTKCGKDRLDSPSTVRCKECHEKFAKKKAQTEHVRESQGICVQCGTNPSTGHSSYCAECRQKNAEAKRNLQNQKISIYSEANTNCKVCNGPLDSTGSICFTCLNQKSFTKVDALKRYQNKCSKCPITDESLLQIVSSDISQPRKFQGPELYRVVCFSTNPPLEYKILCDTCYQKEAVEYVQQMYTFLTAKPESVDIDLDSDIIDL